MNTFILIIILGASSSQSGITVVQQEFTSFERCESTRMHINKNLAADARYQYAEIRSQGCFKK